MLSEEIAEIQVGLGKLHVNRVVDEVIVSSIYRSTKGWKTSEPTTHQQLSRSNSVRVRAGNGRKGSASILNYIEASVNDPIAMAQIRMHDVLTE